MVDPGSNGKRKRAKTRSAIDQDKGPKSYQGKVTMVNPVLELFMGIRRGTKANGSNGRTSKAERVHGYLDMEVGERGP